MAVAKQKGVAVNVVLYGEPEGRPDRATLTKLVAMLEDPVEDLVRKDGRFKELGLSAADYVDAPAKVVDLLDTHIELLQRPVLVRGKVAIIGRPAERVDAFLS